MFPPVYHHNGFAATHAVGHMLYGYTSLVPVNQRVLNKLSKECNVSQYFMKCTSYPRNQPHFLRKSDKSFLSPKQNKLPEARDTVLQKKDC